MSKIEKINNTIQKLNSELRNIKDKIGKLEIERNSLLDEEKKNKYYCDKCKLNFKEYSSLERHNWKKHPCNNIERHWANKDWSNYKGSTFYKDDPYY